MLSGPLIRATRAADPRPVQRSFASRSIQTGTGDLARVRKRVPGRRTDRSARRTGLPCRVPAFRVPERREQFLSAPGNFLLPHQPVERRGERRIAAELQKGRTENAQQRGGRVVLLAGAEQRDHCGRHRRSAELAAERPVIGDAVIVNISSTSGPYSIESGKGDKDRVRTVPCRRDLLFLPRCSDTSSRVLTAESRSIFFENRERQGAFPAISVKELSGEQSGREIAVLAEAGWSF